MKKKGFTLIELLVAIVIIALLSGLGVVSYRSVFSTAEEKYYNAIESNLLLAGNDYFEDHRDELPVGSEYSTVSLVDLIGNKYIEEVVDTEGNLCSDGTVYAYRENNKFKYEVCLECGSHKSDGRYCSGPAQRKITVSAKKALSNEKYLDIEKSYNKAGYSNGENIITTFSMNSEYSVKQYKVYNTRTDDEPLVCSVSSGTSCSVELEKSGTYRVIAYDEDNKEISSKYINAKIAKGQANFTLDVENKYLISKTECSKNKTTKKLSINIIKQTNEEYESIKYQLYTDSNNKGEYKEPRGLKIEEELESGHYTLDVIVKNYSDDDERMVTKVFDISYLIDVTYEDGSTPITHEVVKGQPYNFLSNLPETKQSYGQELEIRWFNGETQINPSETLVSSDCTFTILGKTAIQVTVENFATYCNKDTGVNGLKYTGSELTLTNTAPSNVTFTNNKGTAVNTYSVKAHIQTPLYIWSDGTSADKTFNCSIVKGDNPMTVTDNQTWNVSYSTTSQTKTITAAAGAAGTVTYSITSQPSGNKFSLSGTTLTMAGGTSTGTHTVVITAHAAGNSNYNSVDIPFTITVSVGVVPNRMTVTTPQTWSPTFSSSAQEKTFTGAASADGTVTYSIPTDKNNATIRGYFTIPTSSTAKLKMKENTPSGEYSVVIRAHATGSGGYEAGDKDITMTVTVGAQACNAPASVTIGTDGKITWPASTNCSSATYQLKIGSGSFEDATSGVNKYDALTASTGTKTVCVKTIKPNNSYSNSSEKCASKEVYSVTLTKGTGISAVTGSGKNHIAGETVSIDATVNTGYTWSKWINTSGSSQVTTTKAYSGTISSNWAYTATTTANTYTLNYSDNLFAARTQSTNSVVATYTANGSYLTLNGTLSTTSIPELWNLESRTINSGDQYKITINYISGTLSCSDSTACTGSNGRPVFVLDLVTDGATFSDRNTSPVSYKTLNLPTSGSSEGTFTVDSSRASANGLKYWIWQKTASNATFTDYKVQIIITKVHSKTLTYNAQYNTLDTPTKTGYTFNGWYTAVSGGTKITSSTTFTGTSNQTLYAQWTPHKVSIEYNGNGSDVTWCSTSTSYNMDSNKFAINSDSSRYKQVVSYGQYISYTSGLNNYNNASCFCYARTGYSVTSGSEWVLSTNSNKKYGHNDLTITSHGIASDAGCNLATTDCSVQVNVNWSVNSYTITYNANGGSGAPSATTYTYATSGTVSLSSTTPTRAGYTFLGWSTSSSATSASYAAGASWNKSNASNTTLYAVWSAKPIQIYYHPNGGSVTASGYTTYSNWVSQNGTSYFYQTVNSGGNSDPYNYTTFGITRTGYSVPDGTEWCTNNSGGGTCFDHDVKYTYEQYKAVATEKTTFYEVDLYTHWTINKIYLRYNVNGGTWAGSTNTNLGVSDSFVTYNGNSTTVFAVDYNGTINLADWNNASYINISKTGYSAVSGKQWCTGTSGNGTCYNHSTDYAGAGTDGTASTHFCDARTSSCTVTLYVNWAPNTYKVTLDNQSATSAGTTEVWYQYNTTKSISGTTCYYYTNSGLTSCLSGGYNITKPTKNGYKFGGYYTEKNGSGTQYVNESGSFVNSIYKTTGDRTLYAKWTAKTTPTLTISPTSGTVVKGKTMTFTIKSNVAGSFALSSNATGKATVSPTSQAAAANTNYTITVTGVADGTATISIAFTPNDTTNYNNASGSYTANITKSATAPTTSYCKSLTYNGSSQTLVNTAGTGYTWTAGTTRTDAGSQNVTATLSSGYRWSDNGTGTKTISCSIGQATPSFAKTESSKSIYKSRSDTYGLIPSVAGKITSSTSNSGVASVSQASNCSSIGANAQCVITVTGNAVGSATMTHTFVPTSANYKSVTTTMPVTIKDNAFTVTFAGVNPISTSFDGSTVTLAGNVGVPAYASSTLSLSTNTNYVVSFDYKCASGSNQFDVDFYPDSLPQTNPTATTTLQHMDWITSSSNSAMGSTQLRFFDDFQASNESDITITNIMLSRTSTKTVYYGSTYGDLPAPTRSGYKFNGWYTASNGGTQITSSSTVSTTSNHTLYARWTKTTCCPSGGWYNGGYCYTGSIGNTGEGTCRNLSGYYWISNNCYSGRYGASC